MAMKDLTGLPPVVQLPDEQEDPRQAGLPPVVQLPGEQEDPRQAGLPPVVQLPDEQEDPRQAGRDFVQAPDWEQQGHPGLPEEPLRGKEEEDRRRLERVGGLEGFVLAEKVAREVKSPRVE